MSKLFTTQEEQPLDDVLKDAVKPRLEYIDYFPYDFIHPS